MAAVPQPNLGAFSDSLYAAELQRGDPSLPFAPKLETEYARAHLLNSRTLIRMACVLAALVTIVRVADRAIAGAWNDTSFALLGLVISAVVASSSIALAWIAWSPAFERLYTPVARILVPLRNVIAAAPIAAMAAQGQRELLMLLPVMVLGPFFFLGLNVRLALVSVVLTIVSFAASALFFDLPLAVALRATGFLVMVTIACAFAARQLEKLSRTSFLENRLLAELAEHDALTGTKNRRVFDEHLARLWQQAMEDQRSITIVLIDIDYFKPYNDRYGHQAGDQTLRRVAQVLQGFVCRPLDVLARYGGEEFAAILYDIDGTQAQEIAERMRHAVNGLAIEHRGSRTSRVVTISIGAAVIVPTSERRPRGALQLADQALYEAKVNGRNRVEVVGEAEYSLLVTGVFSTSAFARRRS